MKKPGVSVVIVSWNRKEDLSRAIKSIKTQDYESIEIIVVDNGSTDGSREFLKNEQGVQCIFLDKNHGTSITRNMGTKKASGKYIIYLDSDALFHKTNTISKAINIMETDPKIGALSAVVYSDENEEQIFTAGNYLDWRANLATKSTLPIKKRLYDIDYISSCISFNRKKALEDIGGFDPYFFFFDEDTDLGIRMKKAGWKILVDPEITGLHLQSNVGRKVSFLNLDPITAKNKVILKDYSNSQIITYYKRMVGELIRNLYSLALITKLPFAKSRSKKTDFLEKTYVSNDFSKLTKIYLMVPNILKETYISLASKYIKNKINKTTLPRVWYIFITDRCNCRCKHCFYWKKLNTKRSEMTLIQYRKLIKSVKGKIENVNLTGGEPFLREDLVELCQLFSKESKIKGMSIPTNGIMPEFIANKLEEILRTIRKDINVQVQISLEGPENLNDELRGVKGGYKKSIKTIKLLKKLQKRYSNFEVVVSTTVTNNNIKYLKKFSDDIRNELNVQHNIFLVRSANDSVFGCHPDLLNIDFETKNKLLPKMEELEDLYNYLVLKNHLTKGHKTLFKIGMVTLKKKRMVTPCFAGKIDLVVYPTGDVAFCELIKPFANLNKVNFNLPKLWNSKGSNLLRKRLKYCGCTHSCNIRSNIIGNVRERIKEDLDI